MTVVAWDGRTLAADKRMSIGCHVVTVRKIYRSGDSLVAFTGTAKHVGALLAWFADGAKPEAYPKFDKDESCGMTVVHRNGMIQRYEDSGYPIGIEDRQFANGSGGDYARAAMHLGCSAVEAVEVACRFDENCGNGIDVLQFEEAP